MMKKLFFFSFIVSLALISNGCKKNKSLSKKHLTFSSDTLVFDTIFTTIGSTTKQLKIYNPDNQPINIESIKLKNGTTSPFRINVNGKAGISFSNIRIEEKDSIYTFIDVKLEANNQSNPMVIEDEIQFKTNGVTQSIHLAVWGRDMYYHYSDLEDGSQLNFNEGTWSNDKPHLIYGAAIIDEGKSLTIPAGTEVYLHKNARLIVYKSTLNIQGELNNEVTFQGDRLEADYENVTNQYYAIYFQSARPSNIKYLNLKNGSIGIHLFGNNDKNSPSDYTLTITNSKILNNGYYGIFTYRGASIKAENTIISQNESFGFLSLVGGKFNFNHCNILGYNSANQNQAFGVINYFTENNLTYVSSVNGSVTNSIIYGYNENEIGFDTLSNISGITIQLNFQRNLIRKDTSIIESFYSNNHIWNKDPQFEDFTLFKFNLAQLSPAIGKADNSFPYFNNINIQGVAVSPPNLGSY